MGDPELERAVAGFVGGLEAAVGKRMADRMLGRYPELTAEQASDLQKYYDRLSELIHGRQASEA